MPARDGFDFDQPPSPGTNRHAADNGCPTCGGDRLVLVEEREDGTEAWGRCPACTPAPAREPVQGARWQDYDR